ncbi:MAG: efflux RND transporter periplasmic adaptor subunit [Acidobacteriota bacterium]
MSYLRNFRRAAPALILISAMGISCGSSAAGGGGNQNRAGGNTESKTAPIAITVGKSETRSVQATLTATGSLVANETSDIAPKVAGKVANVYVNVGQFVSQGAMVIKIDDTNAKTLLSSAQASVRQATSGVRQAEAKLGLGPNGQFNASAIPEVRAAEANYQQALAQLKQAENNEQRYRDLIESGDVAMMTYEQYRTARDTARAQAASAKEMRDVTVNTARQNNQAIASAKAAVDSAQQLVIQAQQAIVDTIVRAPFPGYISNRPTAVGEYVTSASIVATILRTNPIKVDIQVAEADVPGITIGRGVSVQVDAFKDRRFAGTVSAVNPAIDTSSRSAVVEALIENNDNSLRAGMFASVQITRQGGSNGVFVPTAAVFNDRTTQSYRVFTIKDGIATLQVVQPGPEENGYYQILSGLEGDQTVAISNVDQLYEGAAVTF